jgi:hypothetical protein
VKLSGSMVPPREPCSRSSPTASEAVNASWRSPSSSAPSWKTVLVCLIGVLLLEARNLLVRSGLLLDVVPHLLRDHVCPGEVAAGAQLLLHLPVEAEVEVDALVAGAVEGADGRAGGTAGGVDPARVEDQLRVLIGLSVAPEGHAPGLLGVGEDVGAEVLQVAVGILGRGDARRLAGRLARGVEAGGEVERRTASAPARLEQGRRSGRRSSRGRRPPRHRVRRASGTACHRLHREPRADRSRPGCRPCATARREERTPRRGP